MKNRLINPHRSANCLPATNKATTPNLAWTEDMYFTCTRYVHAINRRRHNTVPQNLKQQSVNTRLRQQLHKPRVRPQLQKMADCSPAANVQRAAAAKACVASARSYEQCSILRPIPPGSQPCRNQLRLFMKEKSCLLKSVQHNNGKVYYLRTSRGQKD
jgi:hypothetical protein